LDYGGGTVTRERVYVVTKLIICALYLAVLGFLNKGK
jgi:hypothetical protein